MDWVWYYADSPSKHYETVTTYYSLTGNEWFDLFIVMLIVLLPPVFLIWNIERNK